MKAKSSQNPGRDAVSPFVLKRIQHKAKTSGGEMIFQRAAVNLQFTCQLWRLINQSSQLKALPWLLKEALGRDFGVLCHNGTTACRMKMTELKLTAGTGGVWWLKLCRKHSCETRVSVCCWHSLWIQAGLHFSIISKRGHADAHQRSGHSTNQQLAKQLAVGAVGPIRLIHPVWDLPAGCIEGTQLSCSLICWELSFCGELKLCWSEYIIKYVNL